MALSNYAARIDRTELCIQEIHGEKIHAFPLYTLLHNKYILCNSKCGNSN
jgi:hypothetical protein